MTKPMIIIHNVETGEILEREMNDAEFAQYEADQTAQVARATELHSQAQAKDEKEMAKLKKAENEAIAARKIMLDKLGITEEEAKLLLG